MSVQFCEKWFFAGNRPVKQMAMETARSRHLERRPYCAVIGGFAHPTHVVSVAREWISVHFFDESKRAYLNYDFKEIDEGRVFLSMAVFREYGSETTEIERSTSFSFASDGSVVMSVQEQRGDLVESETRASIEQNWADYPTFGDYASLCDVNRVSGCGNRDE